MTARDSGPGQKVERWGRAAVWLPGLTVALGAAVATAHGLYEVATAAGVPAGIAWIYPLITDGLALVAYTATARLTGSAARYAWTVVIVSAGLSGLAQASYLAADTTAAAGPESAPGLAVSAGLRFGVGAWPAIAAAIVAHLLYLLAATRPGAAEDAATDSPTRVRVPAFVGVPPSDGTPLSGPDTWDTAAGVPPALDGPVIPGPSRPDAAPDSATSDDADVPARDRARTAAQQHRHRHDAWPTVRELQDLAAVGRGTAARALQHLRDAPQQAASALHLVTDEPEDPREGHQP